MKRQKYGVEGGEGACSKRRKYRGGKGGGIRYELIKNKGKYYEGWGYGSFE